MKKLFLLSVLALGAMTMSAQLELIGTVAVPADQLTDNNEEQGIYDTTNRPPFQYFATTDTTSTTVTLHFFEYATLSEVKSVTLNRTILQPSQWSGYGANALFIYKNFWANDNKIYFLLSEGNKEDWNLNLYNEDGNLIKSFNACCVYFLHTNIGYLLLEETGDKNNYQTKVYQIPGNGQPTDLESPTAPARTSSARKVVENGQMYIILDGVKYAVTGSTTM